MLSVRITIERLKLTVTAVCVAATVAGASANVARAAPAGVPFTGSVTYPNLCAIVVQQDGTMTASPDTTQMSSKFVGGVAGVADIYSFRNFFISVDTPTTFITFPTNGDAGVTFAVTYSGTDIFRGRTFAEQPGSNKVRLRGNYSVTRVTVNLAATKLGGFPAGDYSAYAVVRCE